METIEAEFVPDPGNKQQASGEAKTQSKDVNKRIREVFPEISESDEEVVFYHIRRFRNNILD
jgi:hypothetical protein